MQCYSPAYCLPRKTSIPTNSRQLNEELPTPNVYRNASGAPGHAYWQQQADYEMDITLNDEKQQIFGEETITYHNQSPDVLTYLWLQLDQNMRALDSDTKKTATGKLDETMSFAQLKRMHREFDGGFKVEYVKQTDGKAPPLHHPSDHDAGRSPCPSPTWSQFFLQH